MIWGWRPGWHLMIRLTESLTRGSGTAYTYDYMITMHDDYMISFTESLTRGPGTLYAYYDLIIWYWHAWYMIHRQVLIFLITILISINSSSVMILSIVFRTLHAQYIFRTDPLSLGAAFHAAQVQILVWVIHQLRISIQLSWSAPLFRSLYFGTDTFVVYVYVYSGVRRGPVPSYDSVITLRGL